MKATRTDIITLLVEMAKPLAEINAKLQEKGFAPMTADEQVIFMPTVNAIADAKAKTAAKATVPAAQTTDGEKYPTVMPEGATPEKVAKAVDFFAHNIADLLKVTCPEGHAQYKAIKGLVPTKETKAKAYAFAFNLLLEKFKV